MKKRGNERDVNLTSDVAKEVVPFCRINLGGGHLGTNRTPENNRYIRLEDVVRVGGAAIKRGKKDPSWRCYSNSTRGNPRKKGGN